MLCRKWSIRWRKPYDALKSFVAANALVACWESHEEESWRSTCLQWKRWRKMSWYLRVERKGGGGGGEMGESRDGQAWRKGWRKEERVWELTS